MKITALIALLALPPSVLASPPGGGSGQEPPAEAIEACSTLDEGDTCSFTQDDETVTGTCMAGPQPELPLACRPEGPPPRR